MNRLFSPLLLLLLSAPLIASSSFRGPDVVSSVSDSGRSLEGEDDVQHKVKLDRKQLIFFAGPHSSGSTSVEDFFQTFSAYEGRHKAHPTSNAWNYWRWPRIHGQDMHKGYGKMVTEPDNEEYMAKVYKLLHDNFESSTNGLFIASEEFDQVGPDSIYDALKAMKDLAAFLNLKNSDVHVILNYRSPRLDQWVSLWKQENGAFKDSTYEDYLCLSEPDKEEKLKRYNMIGCQMNPLGAAKVFLDQGWSVHLMDTEGTEKAGIDVSHAIGCEVLQAECKNGSMGNAHGVWPHANSVDKPFELDDDESAKIEELFRNRDCGYMPLLKSAIDDGSLLIEYKDTLWQNCNATRADYYEGLVDATDTLYQAFLSQLNCKGGFKGEMDMDHALGRSFVEKAVDGFVDIIVVPSLFLIGAGYIIMMMVKGQEQRRLDERGEPAGTGAEMTPYPSSAFRDGDEEDDDEVPVEAVPEDEDPDAE